MRARRLQLVLDAVVPEGATVDDVMEAVEEQVRTAVTSLLASNQDADTVMPIARNFLDFSNRPV